MNQNSSLAIILAAGRGSRMAQDIPKPLVKVYDKPILSWIMDGFKDHNTDLAVIINPKDKNYFKSYNSDVIFIYQENPKGTGHAVMQASHILKQYEYIYVFVGDSPFVDKNILLEMYTYHVEHNRDVTILSSIFRDKSFPYARIVRDDNGDINKIVEEIEATKDERDIKELFCSHYLFKSNVLSDYILRLKENPKTREIYFTDILNKLITDDKIVDSLIIDNWKKLVGLNTIGDIEWAESQKMI